MKKLLFSGMLSLAAALAAAGQVSFVKGSLQSALQAARAAGKPLFVEVFSPACHVCQGFVPLFNQPQVGQVYNRQFVSYRLDVNTPEANAFLARQKLLIPSLPYMLFYDTELKLRHHQYITASVQSLLDLAARVQNAGYRSENYATRFRQGLRDRSFLADYALAAMAQRDTAANLQAVNAFVAQLKPAEYAGPLGFGMIEKGMMDTDNPLFVYFIQHLGAYRKKFDPRLVNQSAERVVMSTLYASRARNFPAQKFATLRQQLIASGVTARSADSRVILPEVQALLRAGREGEALGRGQAYFNAYKPDAGEYLYLTKVCLERSRSPMSKQILSGWLTEAEKGLGNQPLRLAEIRQLRTRLR